jgi:hypothetical protein
LAIGGGTPEAFLSLFHSLVHFLPPYLYGNYGVAGMDVSSLSSKLAAMAPSIRPKATENKGPEASLLMRLQRPLEFLSGQALADEKASFSEELDKYFRQAGISVPPEALLKTDRTGAVRVVTPHPQQDQIEQLFREKPELQQSFVKISNAERLARAAENHKRVMQEYDRLKGNVEAQRALIMGAIASNKAPYYMQVRADGIHSFFGAGSSYV